jgi:hypothetical protein
MKKRDKVLYTKAVKVVQSCETFGQLRSALRFTLLTTGSMSTRFVRATAALLLSNVIESKMLTLRR